MMASESFFGNLRVRIFTIFTNFQVGIFTFSH